MLADVVPYLACPHCGAGFTPAAESLRCANAHVFDVARQGYVTLGTGKKALHPGDSAEMISARDAFLGAGHLDSLREAVAAEAAEAASTIERPVIVDAGAGTGYYLAGVLDRLPEAVGIALDSSRFALRRAARAHPRIGAVGCDIWSRLPLADSFAAVVLDVFSPRNGPEFARLLAPGGRLLVVTPTPRHLQELREPLGLINVDPQKEKRLEAELSPRFTPMRSAVVEQTLTLSGPDVAALVAMGPSARHVEREELGRRIARLTRGSAPWPAVSVSVTISMYRAE